MNEVKLKGVVLVGNQMVVFNVWGFFSNGAGILKWIIFLMCEVRRKNIINIFQGRGLVIQGCDNTTAL